jgi:cytohesin
MKIIGPFARQMVNIEGEQRAQADSCSIASYMGRIWALAANGDRAGLQERIDAEPSLAQRRGVGGRTLLWEAARHDRQDIARWLLDLGADVDAPGIGKPSYGKTSPAETLVMASPHCVAAMRKKTAMADLLLAAGAKVDIYTASMVGDLDAVEGFITADPASADSDDPAEDFYPVTPLHHAVCGKQVKVVDALLGHGVEVERHSVRLLTLASRRNALAIAGTLLANGATAHDCASLLYDVVDVGALDWAKLLIAHGADPSGVGVRGRTLVEFPAVAEMMLAKGATPAGLLATCNGNNGNRGIHPEYAQALLDHGADPNGDGDDRTPLNTAAKSGFDEYVTILLARGADPNIADRQGRTPLSRAFDTRHWDIATQLVRGGAKLPDAPLNKTGETLLHKAAKAGHVELIQALLDAGADPHAATIAGKTAVDYAQRAKKDDVVTALTRTGP